VKIGTRDDKEAKRGEGRKKEEAKGGERKKLRGEREKENQFIYFLFHQSLPPLEYKTHLNRLTTKPELRATPIY
jgi:hypothetical protein